MNNNNSKQWIQLTLIIIPLLVSIALLFNIGISLSVTIIFLFLFVGFLPVCKKRENLWMFVLSSILLLPTNIKATTNISQWLEMGLNMDLSIIKILICCMFLHIIICFEQIGLGFLTRLIWKKQYVVEI